MEECIFCKIINVYIPCHKVYEDEKALAFLDIHPIQAGHTLVISKAHEPHFEKLDDEDYLAVMKAVKQIASKLKFVFASQRACVRVEGFDVPHAHVHVYPANSPDEFYGPKDRMDSEPDHGKLAETAERLRF